jgi:hypothetical protein
MIINFMFTVSCILGAAASQLPWFMAVHIVGFALLCTFMSQQEQGWLGPFNWL